jgi:lipopolysaccharide transport system permease protein
MKAYWPNPLAVFQSFWRHRQVIWQMTRRDVLGRYRGSLLGMLWAFVTPLFLLCIYTFVFGIVFRARWGQSEARGTTDFALILFSGLILFQLFSECLNRAPTLILSNANFVKRVVFPIEVLPWTALGSALFHASISFVVLLTAQLAVRHTVPWTVIFLPLLAFPLILLTVGLSWLLASLGVFLRDIGEAVGVFTTALLFLSPIFYPPSAIPQVFRPLLYINPLTFVIAQTRAALFLGVLPHWQNLAIYCALCWAVAWLGFLWFQKTRHGFADVI